MTRDASLTDFGDTGEGEAAESDAETDSVTESETDPITEAETAVPDTENTVLDTETSGGDQAATEDRIDTDEIDTNDTDSRPKLTTTFSVGTTERSCGRCGESVRRRWHDDGALVCAACKSW